MQRQRQWQQMALFARCAQVMLDLMNAKRASKPFAYG
jgi:hypothetical protein